MNDSMNDWKLDPRLESLVAAHLDGRLSDEDWEALRGRLHEDCAVRDYFRTMTDLHASLLGDSLSAGEALAKRDGAARESEAPLAFPVARKAVRIALAAAACLVLGMSAWWWQTAANPVTLARAAGAVFDDRAPEMGRRLGDQSVRLASGLVELDFPRCKASVLIEAPAVFRVVDRETLWLESGRLTADVQHGDEQGLRVLTPDSDVLDLGTRFAVDVVEGRGSEVHVYERETTAATRSRAPSLHQCQRGDPRGAPTFPRAGSVVVPGCHEQESRGVERGGNLRDLTQIRTDPHQSLARSRGWLEASGNLVEKMAKRKKKKPQSSPDGGTDPNPPGPQDRAAFMAAVQKELDLSGGETLEEAQAKLNQLLAGKSMDEVIEASGVSSDPAFAAIDVLRGIDWEEDSPVEIRKAAKKALEIDPGCCDAYVVLSELEESPADRQKLLEQAVEAGRCRHAEMIESLPEDGPGLWGFHDARPFLQAMYELGNFHRRQFRMEECRAVFEEMLRLNPGDNQGVRYDLVNVYAMDGDWKAVDRLLARYPDEPSCSFSFTLALSTFRKAAALPGFRPDPEKYANPFAKIRSPLLREANGQLKKALEKWPWTGVFLLDCRCLGVMELSRYRHAHPQESLVYAQSAYPAWAVHPDTFLWLATEVRRWVGAPAVKEAVRKRLDDFIEMLDVIESVEPRELGLVNGKDGEVVEILFDFCELASEIADDLIAAAEEDR